VDMKIGPERTHRLLIEKLIQLAGDFES
jgi:hypothetical protein